MSWHGVLLQIQELQGQLETKEKEARGHALTAKLAQRKLEEVKASAAKAVAGVHARVAEAVAAAEARHKQQDEARVHLMLCVIREPEEATPQGKPVVQPAQHEVRSQPSSVCCCTVAVLARQGVSVPLLSCHRKLMRNAVFHGGGLPATWACHSCSRHSCSRHPVVNVVM